MTETYNISNCLVQKANKDFNDLGHPFELNVTNKSKIEITEQKSKTFKFTYNFTNINSILELPTESIIGIFQELTLINKLF